jgi:hypothetical protein
MEKDAIARDRLARSLTPGVLGESTSKPSERRVEFEPSPPLRPKLAPLDTGWTGKYVRPYSASSTHVRHRCTVPMVWLKDDLSAAEKKILRILNEHW